MGTLIYAALGVGFMWLLSVPHRRGMTTSRVAWWEWVIAAAIWPVVLVVGVFMAIRRVWLLWDEVSLEER